MGPPAPLLLPLILLLVVILHAPAETAGPGLIPTARAAEDAGRATPPVCMVMPCIHSKRREEVRAGVHAYLDIYPRFEAYAALLKRCEVPDAENALRDGWTDAMIDAVVPHGDQKALAESMAAYRDAGVAELAFLPVGVGTDPAASVQRSWEVLSELVPEEN